MGRNTTGPPRAAPGELRCVAPWSVKDADDKRRQTHGEQNNTCPLHYV